MTLVRFVACAALAAPLALPAVAAAQGPNHYGGINPPQAAQSGAPCWVDPDAPKCLNAKLQKDIARHRLSPARAAALQHRIDKARAEEKRLRDTYRQIDAELHGG